MEILFYLSSACLILFMILATYDGFYLHLWKYELFNKTESAYEHKTHTVRAILFPLIIWCLFIDTDNPLSFYLGLGLVAVDLITLALDAYAEDDSSATRITIVDNTLGFTTFIADSAGKDIMQFIAVNIIPGSVVLALIHLILIFPFGKSLWNTNRLKITCC